MGIGIFTDKKPKPSLQEIKTILASASEDWDNLNNFVAANFKFKSDFVFYGKNYGWSIRQKTRPALLYRFTQEKDILPLK